MENNLQNHEAEGGAAGVNPKSEIRSPKEIRNPKSEILGRARGGNREGAGWGRTCGLLGLVLCAGLWGSGCIVVTRSSSGIHSSVTHTTTFQSPTLELTVERTEPEVSGRWTAQLGKISGEKAGQFWFSFTVRDEANQTTKGVSANASEFPALMAQEQADWPGQFEYATDAGRILFRGERDGRKAQGTFEFAPDTNYARQVQASLKTAPSGVDCFWLAVYQVTAEQLAAYAQAGEKLSVADICRLKAQGVSPEYLATVRKTRPFPVEEVIRLRNQGVSADFPAAFKDAGYPFKTEELIRARNHAVSAADAKAWKEAGFNFGLEELIRMRNYGVRPEFGKAVREALNQATPEELVKLRNYGVSEQFLREMRRADGQFTAEDLVYLRSRGVQPDYVVEWRKAGFGFSAQELASLRNHGVPASYAAVLNVPNRKPLTADMIVKLRSRGLSAEEIRALRE